MGQSTYSSRVAVSSAIFAGMLLAPAAIVWSDVHQEQTDVNLATRGSFNLTGKLLTG
jgi:hypothetical protein